MKKRFVIAAALFLVIGACGGDSEPSSEPAGSDPTATATAAGDAANGETLFEATCVACHGQGGVGIEGLGKPMPGSAFINGLSDAELVSFIKTGRGTSDPENTTGVDMPAKGGNPSLNDQDLADIVAYVRTLG